MEPSLIVIRMAGRDFEQDIRPLVKAFYPKTELRVLHFTDYETAVENEASEQAEVLSILLCLGEDEFTVSIRDEECISERTDHTELSDTEYHREYRNQLLRALYRGLSRKTGKSLPWGILTGVRPVKLVMEKLEGIGSDGLCEGNAVKEDGITAFMREKYYCSDEKAELSLSVARRELKLLNDISYKEGYSLYIGIPFCPSICSYCSFGSHPIDRNRQLVEPYLDALIKEIDYASACFPDRRLETVYFGGGTPTSISAGQLERVINRVKERFDMKYVAEFTVEAGRPDSITEEKLNMMKKAGVTRISVNPQTMVQRTLDVIGRRHTALRTEEAFHLARQCGFDNINMDIIIGLTGEDTEDVRYTLGRIEELMPDSLTVHTLAIKRAARLNTEKELYEEMEAKGVCDMQRLTQEFALTHGYSPYYLYRQKNITENLENIGYSKPGKEGLYNILIMEEKQIILALGAGASSKFVFESDNRFERVENVKGVREYITRIDEMLERKGNFIRTHLSGSVEG